MDVCFKDWRYLLNRVPSKAVRKTPFELWTGMKASLRHLHVWGCVAEVRVYNPQEKKRIQEQSVVSSLVIKKNLRV